MIFSQWLRRFLQPQYIGCGKKNIVGLCHTCVAQLPHIGKHCPTCANSVADARFSCGACLRHPPAFSQLLVHWQFTDLVRDIILRSKFQADRLALRILENETERLVKIHPVNVEAVIAMPIANNRLQQRGFNQTLFPARTAAKILKIPVISEGLLYKQRRQPQSLLNSATARRRNIRDAFAVRGELPQRLLLVDDVVTSGATLQEAAKTLKEAGVKHIVVLALAATKQHTYIPK